MGVLKRVVKAVPPIKRLVQQRDALAEDYAALAGVPHSPARVAGAGGATVSDTSSSGVAFFGESNALHQRYPEHAIGRWTYGGLTVHSWNEGEPLTHLSIGAFCSIAAGVQIFLGGEHRSEWVSTFPFNMWDGAHHLGGPPKSKGDVVIGNDVWIGTEAMIVSGVRIGDGAVIGARALVARDVEAYAIVAGNPARVIGRRFSEDIVERLLRIRWWDWSDERILEFLPCMMGPDIESFLKAGEALHAEK